MAILEPRLKISKDQWRALITSLAARGEGVRESGAFLLSDTIQLEEFMFYDDLDPNCLDSGYIHFRACGYGRL